MAAIQYEESYDIDSDMSEDDCRKDTTSDQNTINLNESLPISVDCDETNMNTMNIKNGSIRSASINIDIARSDKDITISHGRARNKTIELYSENIYDLPQCGRCYRLCCYSAFGIKITILLNLVMIILNSGLIIYEAILIIRQQSIMHTELPFWYMICDFIVTIILFIEILWTIGAINKCSLYKYFKSGWECWIDIIVLILSIACCAAYYLDITNADIDNFTMLFVRVIRDIIRIIRCVWFFKMLYICSITLKIRKNTHPSWSSKALLTDKLTNRALLEINSSPKSTCSDQRYYKGPKRVHVYDENDIVQLFVKSNHKNKKYKKYKNGKMYSLTPPPPHSQIKNKLNNKYDNINKKKTHKSHKRNITRNCDEIRLDEINGNDNYINDNEITIMSDDKSVISINSNIMSTSNPLRSVIHHRQNTTKLLGNSFNNNNNNSYNENESLLSCNTDSTYWDNLKLRHIKKKSVDKQRLKDILRGLPSGSIIDRESFSIEYDDNDIDNLRLHNDNDRLTII